MKARKPFSAAAVFVAVFLIAALAGCSQNSAPPPGAHLTPPQSAAQIASEEQMRQEHNARKNQ